MRARKAPKRAGGAAALELEEDLWVTEDQADAITELREAFEHLEQVDPRQSQLLEHRYFGGLSLEETSEVIGVSLATVKRDLRFARAWLAAELGREPDS
jgi:RNA polymerase sigma factor (TIGR02999 family)